MKNKLSVVCLVSVFVICSCTSVIPDTYEQQENENNQSNFMPIEEAKQILFSFEGDEITRVNNEVEIIDYKEHIFKISSDNSYTEDVLVYEIITKQAEEEGFALVLGDNRGGRVLAYVPKGSLKDTVHVDVVRGFFNSLPYVIESVLYPEESQLITKANLTLPPTEYTTRYISTQWGQGYPYNALVPRACGTGKAPTGCAAVAVGQIMGYHRYPTTFNWSLILSSPTVKGTDSQARINEVGRLMVDIGSADKASIFYGCSSSSAIGGAAYKALRAYGYQVKEYPFLLTYVQEALQKYGPIYVSGSGHAFVVDGMKKEYFIVEGTGRVEERLLAGFYYRMNFGWDGYCDGWYLATNINDPSCKSCHLSTRKTPFLVLDGKEYYYENMEIGVIIK